MHSALTFLLLAAFSLLAAPRSLTQTVNPETGAMCEPQPTGMDAVRNKAETGDAAAEYELGRSMLSQRPTESEFASAMPWLWLSAEQGYPPAEYMYGRAFREEPWKDAEQLVYWWTKAAEQGNVRAQLSLGSLYYGGQDGVKRDYVEAFKWLSMAAKQGEPAAQDALGQTYEYGDGVPQDYGLAAYWYRQAADHTMDLGGAGQGAHNLSLLYEDGHATPQDYVFVYMAYGQDTDGIQDVAQKMNTGQIADAQRRVRAWVKAGEPCPSTAATSSATPSPTTPAR